MSSLYIPPPLFVRFGNAVFAMVAAYRVVHFHFLMLKITTMTGFLLLLYRQDNTDFTVGARCPTFPPVKSRDNSVGKVCGHGVWAQCVGMVCG